MIMIAKWVRQVKHVKRCHCCMEIIPSGDGCQWYTAMPQDRSLDYYICSKCSKASQEHGLDFLGDAPNWDRIKEIRLKETAI